jgi:prepilin-type N-terminal cleavage/methylation domain-containing protein
LHAAARNDGDRFADELEMRFMAQKCGARGAQRAFSLIELLVVVGLIVILVGGFGVALTGRGGEGAALTNAQSILSGMVQSARAQAALYQVNTRLIVYAQMPPSPTADASKYLRVLQVVRGDTLPTGMVTWTAVGDPVSLPAPICVVPPAPVPTNHLGLPTGQAWNNNVATGPVSTLTQLNSFTYSGQPPAGSRAGVQQAFGVQGQSIRVLYLEFSPDGTVLTPTGLPSGTPIKIALATATLTAGALPRFNNAFGVRGLFVRKTGAVAFVNDATGF